MITLETVPTRIPHARRRRRRAGVGDLWDTVNKSFESLTEVFTQSKAKQAASQAQVDAINALAQQQEQAALISEEKLPYLIAGGVAALAILGGVYAVTHQQTAPKPVSGYRRRKRRR